MKHFLLSLFTLLFLATGYSQNPIDIISSHGTDTSVGVKSVSLANPWIGSKLAYNVDESRPLDESFILSAKILTLIVGGENFAIPVVGEVGLGDSDIFNPSSGVNLGIYPFYRLSNVGGLQLYAHGGVAYKVITDDVGVDEPAPTQFKILGGLEAVFSPKDGGSPTTLSVTPLYMFNTNSEVGNTGGLEVSFVLPIAKGLGFLAEGLVPFKNGDVNSGLRLGVIVNGKL